MKRLTALIISMSLCIGLCSCKGNSPNDKKPENITAQSLTEIAYKRSVIELPDELLQIYRFSPYNDSNNFMILGMADVVPAFYTTDSSFTELTRLSIPDFLIGQNYELDIADDGSIISVVNDVSYGDLPAPDIYAEDYDEELYNNAAEYTLKINKYSIDGTLISSEIIADSPVAPTKNTQFSSMVTDGENAVVSIDNTYCIIGADGSFKGELSSPVDGYKLMQVGKDRLGQLYCAVVNFDDDKMQLCRINTETFKAEPSDITYNFTETISNKLLPGTGDYSMFVSSPTTIYGIKTADSSIEPVFSLDVAAISANDARSFYLDPNDNTLVVSQFEMTAAGTKLRRYTPCTPEELAAIPTVTVGTFGDDIFLKEEVAALNETQSDYRVELKVYSSDTDEYEAGLEQFQQEFISGDVPDVLDLTEGYHFGEVDMINMGGLCDLYDFMENDPDLTKDMLVENIASLVETDGKMYALPNRFLVNCGYAVKEKYAAQIPDLSLQTIMDIKRNLPEGTFFDTSSWDPQHKYSRFTDWDQNQFIDFENGTCDFNNQLFIDFLNYCNEVPLEVESKYNFDEMTEEERFAYFEMSDGAIRNDIALFDYATYGSYSNYMQQTRGVFGSEPVTYMGNENGPVAQFDIGYTFAITETSENKELAWQFIKQFCSDEYYKAGMSGGRSSYGFPITKSGLDIYAVAESQPKSYSDSNGEDPEYTGEYYYIGMNNPVKIGHMDETVIGEMNDIIASVKTTPKFESTKYGWDYHNIIYEEIDRFFSGESTAEQCADAIQSRLSIYLAEKS